MNPKIIVGDIDGCVVNLEHRLPYFFSGEMDVFHSMFTHDTPIASGVEVYRKFLNDPDYLFLFITGRNEGARDYTLYQLRKFVSVNIQTQQVLMRPDDCSPKDIPDETLKPRLLLQAGFKLEDVFLVFEDRNCVVDGWRKLGVTCYQTQPGDF